MWVSFQHIFLLPKKGSFLSKNSENTFSWSIFHTKKDKKISNFGKKPWTNPFRKMQILGVFWTDVFIVLKGLFSFENIRKNFLLIHFAQKKTSSFLDKTVDYPLCQNANFKGLLNRCFYSLKRLVFFQQLHGYCLFIHFGKKENWEKSQFFHKNHGLTPLEKCKL